MNTPSHPNHLRCRLLSHTSFKAFIVASPLGWLLHPLHIMSSRLPENAKNSDFEKGKQMSLIPFVPITEEESDPNSHRVSYKLTTGAVSAAVKGTGKWGELEENEAALQAATAEFVAANNRLETAEADLDDVDHDAEEQMDD
eukprot:scaffold82915_cov55-Cyclotella_meneghiniana.AAC.2